MLADAFGMKLLPSALSIVWTISAVPSACMSSFTLPLGFSSVSSFSINSDADILLVAEAMALGLRRSHAPIYLDVQIFAGCMFIGAALFLLPMRFKKRIESVMASEKS